MFVLKRLPSFLIVDGYGLAKYWDVPALYSLHKWMYFLFQVLNLFLALLLSSFGASNLSAAGGTDDDTNKLSEAFNRIGRFRRWVKNFTIRGLIYVKDRIVECCRRQITARRGTRPCTQPSSISTASAFACHHRFSTFFSSWRLFFQAFFFQFFSQWSFFSTFVSWTLVISLLELQKLLQMTRVLFFFHGLDVFFLAVFWWIFFKG